MKTFFFLILLYIFSLQTFAQNPLPASDPMTAPGALGIALYDHTLIWSNPSNIDYNEMYFSDDSILVANLDPSVRIYNGYPSTVFSSASLNVYGPLSYNTKYFWRIVEHNTTGSTPSPVWHFKSRSPAAFYYENNFTSDSEGWEIFGPMGFNNWYWSNTSSAGGSPGEMVFRWDPIFIGESYLISPEFPAAANAYMSINFNYYEDWWSDTVVVGCAYTTDNGNSWTSIWELQATGNVGPETAWSTLYIPGNFRLGFYYLGNSNNIDFFYIDNVGIGTPITVSQPPSFLQALADTTELKVELQWSPGSAPAPLTGYQIQRKSGLPSDPGSYNTIATTSSSTLFYEDLDVELNNDYTYRICTVAGPTFSCYGNEATAYVPEYVPVELVSFNGSVIDNNITLNWITATEINNLGFEVQRSRVRSSNYAEADWETIGFVKGNGTTTESQSYSFIDKNITNGTYFYRLKQIDFDGTFEYSNEITVEVDIPVNYFLSQNYPNPFNPLTTISYSIAKGGLVTLKVFDILGKEVTTLVNEHQQAGKFDLTFDGSNLASGVYYYQLKSENFIATKKLMLMK